MGEFGKVEIKRICLITFLSVWEIQKYLPDDDVRQQGGHEGDQGEKPDARSGQCVQINLNQMCANVCK